MCCALQNICSRRRILHSLTASVSPFSYDSPFPKVTPDDTWSPLLWVHGLGSVSLPAAILKEADGRRHLAETITRLRKDQKGLFATWFMYSCCCSG